MDKLEQEFNDLPVEEQERREQELVDAIQKGMHDPVFWGEYFLGLKFHDHQKIWLWLTTKTQILRAVTLAREIGMALPPLEKLTEHKFLKNILCPANRFGKTMVTAVKHPWYCFYKIGMDGPPEVVDEARYATLNISPHANQVDAAYRYIVDFFNSNFVYDWPDENGVLVKRRNECIIDWFLVDHKKTRREIVFDNNSTIKGVPTGSDQASSLAGTQFYYISYDECSQSLHLKAELPAKIQSRLIDSGGPLDLIGTPEVDKPSHTYYHRIVKMGLKLEDGFFTLTGALKDNPFIGEEEKQSVLESIKDTDPVKYRQVAFGDFVVSGSKMFDNEAIERIWDKSLVKLMRGVPGNDYLMAIDWGFSDTGDPTVIYIFDYTEMRTRESSDEKGVVYYKVIYQESIKGGDPYAVLAKVRILQEEFNDCRIIHDSSSMGGTMIKKMLKKMNVKHVTDFTVSKSPKDEMLFLLVRAMNYGRVTEQQEDGSMLETVKNFGKIRSYLIPDLEEQLGAYRIQDKKIEQDEVMAFGMGIWYLERKYAGQRTKVFNLNLLANTPEEILQVAGKPKPKPDITNRNVSFKERRIG